MILEDAAKFELVFPNGQHVRVGYFFKGISEQCLAVHPSPARRPQGQSRCAVSPHAPAQSAAQVFSLSYWPAGYANCSDRSILTTDCSVSELVTKQFSDLFSASDSVLVFLALGTALRCVEFTVSPVSVIHCEQGTMSRVSQPTPI